MQKKIPSSRFIPNNFGPKFSFQSQTDRKGNFDKISQQTEERIEKKEGKYIIFLFFIFLVGMCASRTKMSQKLVKILPIYHISITADIGPKATKN